MQIQIEYLNKKWETRRSHHILNSIDDCELVGTDIRDILEQDIGCMYISKK